MNRSFFRVDSYRTNDKLDARKWKIVGIASRFREISGASLLNYDRQIPDRQASRSRKIEARVDIGANRPAATGRAQPSNAYPSPVGTDPEIAILPAGDSNINVSTLSTDTNCIVRNRQRTYRRIL